MIYAAIFFLGIAIGAGYGHLREKYMTKTSPGISNSEYAALAEVGVE